MNGSQSSELFLRCPTIYRGRHDGPQRNLMCFGFECGPGWYQILYDLSVAIESIAQNMKQNGVTEGQLPLIVQVKEKFGGLRFYLSNHTAEIDDLITAAEEKAAITCEMCGKPGQLINDSGWYRTVCSACRGSQ